MQIEAPWSLDPQEVLAQLNVEQGIGLDDVQVEQRRDLNGANRLREVQRRRAWEVAVAQFKSLIILLLLIASIASFLFGDWIEGIAIAVVILINAAIGFATEFRAVRSMEALRKLTSVETAVRRAGEVRMIPAEDLVPGDIVLLEAGDLVTADLRVLEASKVQVDESPLTGESVPVTKTKPSVPKDTSLADRTPMFYKGTALTRGSAEAVTTSTGMATELGKISEWVAMAEDESTPLEQRLARLGRTLIWVTIAIAASIAGAGILSGKDLLLMIETSIALAVAAIPEGLPIVATLALARGMWRMASRNALVRKLSAVETLGATTVICTDKTGTLTENRMTVEQIVLSEASYRLRGRRYARDEEGENANATSALRNVLELVCLCNNATLGSSEPPFDDAIGDPMEVALLVAAAREDVRREDLVASRPEIREEAFDPDTRMMATIHRASEGVQVAAKGAPEAILAACTRIARDGESVALNERERARWLDRSDSMAGKGLRVLAAAEKSDTQEDLSPYENLTFAGLVALRDPPREDVRQAIDACQAAGIRVVMVTGDQAETARNIALSVGLVDDEHAVVTMGSRLRPPQEMDADARSAIARTQIFARVSPEQKLHLITFFQGERDVVAMTGDGVNDAPALKKADIGIAMGERGTQVARDAADMVLKDDAFGTIVAAIEQGRVIFSNIRKFVLYLLSCNVSEILAVAIASLAGIPLPLLPLQILFLNLVTDVFPALALGVGEGDPAVMAHSPRNPQEPILTRGHWLFIAAYGGLISGTVLGAMGLALRLPGFSREEAVTVSFLTLAFAQLWHVFNLRDVGSRFLRNDITGNRYIWGALVLCSGLLLSAVYVPAIARVISTEPLGCLGWAIVIGMSFLPYVVGQTIRTVQRRRARSAS